MPNIIMFLGEAETRDEGGLLHGAVSRSLLVHLYKKSHIRVVVASPSNHDLYNMLHVNSYYSSSAVALLHQSRYNNM